MSLRTSGYCGVIQERRLRNSGVNLGIIETAFDTEAKQLDAEEEVAAEATASKDTQLL